MGEPRARAIATWTRTALGAAGSGRRAIGALLSLGLVVVAGVIAPGEAPGIWTWARVLLVWLFATLALLGVAAAPARFVAGQRVSPLLVWGSLLLAVVVSLTFTALTASLAVLILILLLVTLQPGRAAGQPVFWTLVVAPTPLWVWSAFDAWDRWLLMLIPIGLVGIVSAEHALRAGPAARLAAWIGVVALAAAVLAAALVGDIDPGWVTAGAIGAAALAALDVAILLVGQSGRWPSVVLPALALMWLACAWLVPL